MGTDFLKMLSDKMITIEILIKDTVTNLKVKIQDKEGIPSSQQMIMFSLKQLKYRNFLSNYKIQNGLLINLILKLYGESDNSDEILQEDEGVDLRKIKRIFETKTRREKK